MIHGVAKINFKFSSGNRSYQQEYVSKIVFYGSDKSEFQTSLVLMCQNLRNLFLWVISRNVKRCTFRVILFHFF